MNISETCIRRPVLTTLMTASLIVFGAFAYRLLPVAALPAVDFPTIQITATLPGASPETMAASVAAPIERQLSTIAGVSSMTSSSIPKKCAISCTNVMRTCSRIRAGRRASARACGWFPGKPAAAQPVPREERPPQEASSTFSFQVPPVLAGKNDYSHHL